MKVGSQEISRVIGKFVLEVQNEAGQSLTGFCQENMLVIENIFSNSPRDDSAHGHHLDDQHQNQVHYVLCSQR